MATHSILQAAATNPGNGQSASATSRVVELLRGHILTGQLRPGEKLKVEDLRARFGVGASPIREALSLLTSADLVVRLDQRGFRVANVSEHGFQELLMTRCWLEERALRESIAHGGTPWEEALVLAHHRLGRTQRTQCDALIANADWELRHRQFHQALIGGCGSSILLRFCDELYDQNIRYRHVAGRRSGYLERDIPSEHAAITEAALDRDADEAVARLLAHYKTTGEYLGSLSDV